MAATGGSERPDPKREEGWDSEGRLDRLKHGGQGLAKAKEDGDKPAVLL